MGSRIRNLVSKARSEGLAEASTYACFRLYEEYHDRLLGIRTWEWWSPNDLGYRDSNLHGYAPAPYRALQKCWPYVPRRPGVDVFLDYGVGLGRAAVFAARYPFAKVVGIDLSPDMVAGARRNVARARQKLRCAVEIVQADARSYSIPSDVSVIHLNNPFGGEVLTSVVDRIRQSMSDHPRDITVIYGSSNAFETLVRGQGWAERLYCARFYPAVEYAVYRCRPAPVLTPNRPE